VFIGGFKNMNNILIKTEKLCKTFRSGRLETPVLFDIDLEIGRGEFVALMGPSGCGKSTIMHILGMMLSPTSGKVLIGDCDTANLTESGRARLRRERIGFVFQRFNLLGTVSAYQNIAVAQRIRGHKLDGQIDRVLEAVQMQDRAHYKPSQLSIGQQQRVAIARAVVHEPDIIMADEPTGNLDSANAEQVLELMSRIHREQSVTVLMITHSETAAKWADRVIYMNDGRIQNG
jgi:putative ABC transport system ATP-binding protein